MGAFIIKKNKSGKNFFNLKASNGAVIATSEAYKTKGDCEKAIELIRDTSVAASLEDQTIKGYPTEKNPKFELYKDKTGEFRFRLITAKGDTVLKSEGYTVKASCKNGIASVIKNAPEAKIFEE